MLGFACGWVKMSGSNVGEKGSARVRKVTVVGGGIIGAASAYFLAKRGIEVEVLEAVEVASAASGKAGGFLALDWNDEQGNPAGPLSRASFKLHEELAEEFGSERIGYRRVAAVSADFRGNSGNSAEHAKYLGNVRHEMVIGSTDTCAQVHPLKLTRALMDSSKATVTITKVVGLALENGRIVSLQVEGSSPREVQDDETVVFALGPWSSLLSRELGLPEFYGQKAISMVVPTDRPLENYAAFTNWGGSNPEIYPRADEAYVCGFGDGAGVVHEEPGEVSADTKGAPKLRNFTREILGDDHGVPVRACHLPLAGDGLPVIGPLTDFGAANGVLATGHSCWGILNGPATGLAVAELVCDGEIKLLPKWASTVCSPARFLAKRQTSRRRR